MSIKAMKQAIEAWDACGRYPDSTSDIERLDVAINALRPAIQQAESEPVWFHKHWCDGDDIFYRPDDNIPPGSVPLYTRAAPGVPDDVVRLVRFMEAAFVPMTPQHDEIAKALALASKALTAAQAQKGGE